MAMAGADFARGGLFFDNKECANCGATEDLLKCSRCHQAYFCSVACQRAYWPFHRSECRKNDFADAIEGSEPKFSRWMRKHGKIAVLKDDEVDRLERANNSSGGAVRRQEVMESMYGRADPKPIAPAYTPDDMRKMREAEERIALERRGLLTASDRAWREIQPEAGLGLDCGSYKFDQTQATMDVFVRLPSHVTSAGQIEVTMETKRLSVSVRGPDGARVLAGELFREVKADESCWYVRDGILEVNLLKRFRRGLAYGKGETNANTFWPSVFVGAEATQALQGPAPTKYYSTEWRVTLEDERAAAARPARRRPPAALPPTAKVGGSEE